VRRPLELLASTLFARPARITDGYQRILRTEMLAADIVLSAAPYTTCQELFAAEPGFLSKILALFLLCVGLVQGKHQNVFI
jgi:hypothetical protein